MFLLSDLSELAFRTANKVAMQMRCASTAKDAGASGRLIDDSLFQTLHLLDQIDPVSFRDAQQFYQSVFAKSLQSYEMDRLRWSQVFTQHCEFLRSKGLQEKLLADLGTKMDEWPLTLISMDSIGNSLNRLACHSSVDARRLKNCVQAQIDVACFARPSLLAMAFSHAVNGLVLMMTATELTAAGEDKESVGAIASCGGWLLDSSVNALG